MAVLIKRPCSHCNDMVEMLNWVTLKDGLCEKCYTAILSLGANHLALLNETSKSVKQIANCGDQITALCEDGSIWVYSAARTKWSRIPEIKVVSDNNVDRTIGLTTSMAVTSEVEIGRVISEFNGPPTEKL